METRNRRKRTIRLDHIPPAKPSKADRLLSEVQPAFEVDASSIEMKEIINEGSFGKVYRAVLKRKGRKDLAVALKQLFTNGNREMDDLRYHNGRPQEAHPADQDISLAVFLCARVFPPAAPQYLAP